MLLSPPLVAVHIACNRYWFYMVIPPEICATVQLQNPHTVRQDSAAVTTVTCESPPCAVSGFSTADRIPPYTCTAARHNSRGRQARQQAIAVHCVLLSGKVYRPACGPLPSYPCSTYLSVTPNTTSRLKYTGGEAHPAN